MDEILYYKTDPTVIVRSTIVKGEKREGKKDKTTILHTVLAITKKRREKNS